MLVYRSQSRIIEPATALRALSEVSDARDILIELGEIEAGVMDALYPDRDGDGAIARAFRRAGHAAGKYLLGHGDARSVQREIEALATIQLPRSVCVSVPEGYAYYALYPETYADAANDWHREARAAHAVVIGLRSIGTSLSSVAAAALDQRGCEVWSITVRPHGHPFQRVLDLDPGLAGELTRRKDWPFLIVDEGPGLSGSSMCSVAERLSVLGVPDDRIVFLPAWSGDERRFVSESARQRWPRHQKFIGEFRAPAASVDLSGGAWRQVVYDDERAYPAVQPQHEARKYLSREGRLLKFAGLGKYGKLKAELGAKLSSTGIVPAPTGSKDGFLERPFVPGRPLGRADITTELLDAMANYASFRRKHLPAPPGTPRADLSEMVQVNVREGLGDFWLNRVSNLDWSVLNDGAAVRVDGRLLPYEWIATDRGYMAVDALDHGDDHFYPGYTDIAWDLAGFLFEFPVHWAGRERLLDRYRALSGDRAIDRRLPFFGVAYLAFRLGYTTMAASSLDSGPDRSRFGRLARDYGSMLQREILRLSWEVRRSA